MGEGGSDKEKISCKACNVQFTTVTSLKKHVNLLHATGNNKCKKCNRYFKNNFDLLKHMRVHDGYPCENSNCGKIFLTNDGLHTHRRKFHKEAKKDGAIHNSDKENESDQD